MARPKNKTEQAFVDAWSEQDDWHEWGEQCCAEHFFAAGAKFVADQNAEQLKKIIEEMD